MAFLETFADAIYYLWKRDWRELRHEIIAIAFAVCLAIYFGLQWV
jgi:hypothetical protein